MNSVITIRTLGDNLTYLCQYGQNEAIVVDPGDSSPVLSVLDKQGLTLRTILATHHHFDHTAGVADLKRRTACTVVGGDRRIAGIDKVVGDGQILTFGNKTILVLATPGHTRTSVCYYLRPSGDGSSPILWTGDTLFIGGCGRLLECDARSMWESLDKLASLPDETLVYCGHDYTLENYEFALSIEPGNEAVKRRIEEIRQGGNTVPSTMSEEKTTNVFLRAGTPEIKAALGMTQARAVEVFAESRRRKDVF
ncbi:MAG: hydroxyacylglutathione hydrolase [Phycisphaerales bacterium]|nr:MAG: hydroxyacylglutathione hydrolase [Phycisphaerales bacterium]